MLVKANIAVKMENIEIVATFFFVPPHVSCGQFTKEKKRKESELGFRIENYDCVSVIHLLGFGFFFFLVWLLFLIYTCLALALVLLLVNVGRVGGG